MHIAPVRRDAPYALHLVHRTGPRRFLHPEALLALLTTRLGDRVNVSLLFTNCSLVCQVHVFGDADILLTVHGAAETNILFMRPRTVLIEAFPPYFVEGTYMNMAGFLRVQYLSVTTYNSTYFPRGLRKTYGEGVYAEGVAFQKRRKFLRNVVDPNNQTVLNAVEEAVAYLDSYRFRREVFESNYLF